MERREFLINTALSTAAVVGFSKLAWAQGGRAPIDWSADPGKPSSAPAAKRARISLMTLNFNPIIKSPNPPNPNATPNPNAPPASKMIDVFDLAQMFQDVYGVPNIEFQHSSIPSTEDSYLKELRAHIEKAKSRMQQINLEFSAMNISAADPIQRIQAIDLTKRWVDHAVLLNCPKVMVNQGAPTQENKDIAIATLKAMGDYARSKGVKVSMETRGGGGGGARGRAGAAGGRAGGRAGVAAAAAPAAAPAAMPAPAPAPAAPAGPPAWMLLKEIIEKSNTYSNCDIGGVGAANQQALHDAVRALLPTNSGQTHIKVSANWDLGTFVKFYESIGYKGLYTIEVTGHQAIRPVYDTILANI